MKVYVFIFNILILNPSVFPLIGKQNAYVFFWKTKVLQKGEKKI